MEILFNIHVTLLFYNIVKKRSSSDMKKRIFLSIAAAGSVAIAEPVDIGDIDVDATMSTSQIRDVAGEEVQNADVGAALTRNTSSVSLIRRSAVANDIVVRGLKKDNIAVTIDGMKIYGACPNRMDPPVSHILANNIESIELAEGPFDVTVQGAMGASVKVNTLEPTGEFSGDMNLGLGGWDYRKLSTWLTGGMGDFRFALSLSTESAGQYEDGSGNDFAQQQDDYTASHPSAKGMAYKPQYRELDSYTKSTMMGKIYWDITDEQTLKVSYTANRSEDVLYPNTPMDADYDDSDLFDSEWEIRNLSAWSDKLTLHYFHTEVDHPMSNRYRLSSNTKGVIKHWLTTEVDGGRIENALHIGEHSIVAGADYSLRNWDGKYYKNDNPFSASRYHSIYDVDTEGVGVYIKDRFQSGAFVWDIGGRYDHISIDTPRAGDAEPQYDLFSANIMLHYAMNDELKLFAGIGSGNRVPDGKELYYRNKMGIMIGNDKLDAVQNYEIDAGFEYASNAMALKFKAFYNYLQDDILYNSTAQTIMGKKYGRYENMDAWIYGIQIDGSYTIDDSLYVDASLTWMQGEKKDPLTGQSDTDLPEIPPLRFIAGINYLPDAYTTLRAEVQTSARWDRIDSDNGEQELGGWGVLNLNINRKIGEHFEITAGIDNLFDKDYIVSNTYKDLTLVTGGDQTMLLHEPGRYAYVNLRYKF